MKTCRQCEWSMADGTPADRKVFPYARNTHAGCAQMVPADHGFATCIGKPGNAWEVQCGACGPVRDPFIGAAMPLAWDHNRRVHAFHDHPGISMACCADYSRTAGNYGAIVETHTLGCGAVGVES